MWASGKEYAQHRQVDPSRVSQWKRQGRLVLSEDGKKIDVEASDALLNSTLDQGKGERRNGNITSSTPAASAPAQQSGDLLAPGAAPKAQADDPEPLRSANPDYWAHKTRQALFEADLKQLVALERAGALVSAADVRKEASETARKVRNAMLAIADRIAPVLDPANPARAHKLLTDEIQKALRELSDELDQRAAAAARAGEREPALQ